MNFVCFPNLSRNEQITRINLCCVYCVALFDVGVKMFISLFISKLLKEIAPRTCLFLLTLGLDKLN